MKPFTAVNFMQMYRVTDGYYADFAKLDDVEHDWAPADVIAQQDRDTFSDLYQIILQDTEKLELTASMATIKKMLDVLRKPKSMDKEFFELGPELSGRIKDEMASRSFLSLTLNETELYRAPRSGWETIIERFPAAVMDIEVAKKCFALSRYAAAVFHSLQIAEFGLIALGELIGVKDPVPGLGGYFKCIARDCSKEAP